MKGDSVSFDVDERLMESLKNLANGSGCTAQMVLLSAFNILLSKSSGDEDIIVGVPIAGRQHEDLENIIGMFVNTLPLRNRPQGNKKYIDFLKEVRENSLQSYENQIYQLETLIEKLDLNRDTSRNPLFDVMLNMMDTVELNDVKLENLLLKQYQTLNGVSKVDMSLTVINNTSKLCIELVYSKKLFKKERMERFSKQFIRILEQVTQDKEVIISEIDILSNDDKKVILQDFNETNYNNKNYSSFKELFEEQVEKSPNNIAVAFKNTSLTYSQLMKKQIA